jgi:hypothetical protein
MNYKVMKRPMFRVGGPTSGGTGITSGLETPRQNFKHGSPHYQDYVDMIPGAFKKRRTGLENQMGSIGPMAAYSAIGSGALENVHSIGDLAMAFGDPAVLQSVVGGMSAKNKLQSSLDDVDLKEATTMATLLKPSSGGFSTRLKSQQAVQGLQIKINAEKQKLIGLDPNIPEDAAKISVIKNKIGDLTQQMKVFISGGSIRERAILALIKLHGDEFDPKDEDAIQDMIESFQGYKAEGGRINKQMGGGFDMAQAPQAVSQEASMMQPEQVQQPQKDPYMILREKLPPEIPNEVVQLIAYNKEAFEDFANIQTQDDVDLFNQKYNVQLVVDMASA